MTLLHAFHLIPSLDAWVLDQRRLMRTDHPGSQGAHQQEDMIMIDRLIRTARRTVTRKREQNFVTGILNGPDNTFRSELIEVMSRTR
jgi:hypothetical protein